MASTTQRLTYDDLEEIPQEREGDRHELIDGELFVTPSPVPAHQIVSMNLTRHIDRHVTDGQLGTVLYAPVDIRLTPDNVLIPDIIFISTDRLHVIGAKAVDAPPDLVVEILSPGTRRRDLDVKRALYARFGVQEYWIIDLDARTVGVLALIGVSYETLPLRENGSVQSRVLPGLTLGLDEVFADLT